MKYKHNRLVGDLEHVSDWANAYKGKIVAINQLNKNLFEALIEYEEQEREDIKAKEQKNV